MSQPTDVKDGATGGRILGERQPIYTAICAFCDFKTHGTEQEVADRAALHRSCTKPEQHMVFEGPTQ